MRNNLSSVIILIAFFTCSCNQKFDTEHIITNIDGLGILNENTILLNVSYNHYKRIPGSQGNLIKAKDNYTYFLEVNLNTQEQIIKGEKNLGQDKEIICNDGIVGLDGNIFINSNDYKIIKETVPYSISDFHDFTATIDKVLYNDLYFYERNINTNTSTIILSSYVRDAKYCPTNHTTLAYIGRHDLADNMSGDLYTMNSDGTNIVNILSGQNIMKICWKPDGNTIVFLNDNGIWNIDKNGSNLNKVSDFQLPDDYSYFVLYYSLLAFTDTNDKIITERF